MFELCSLAVGRFLEGPGPFGVAHSWKHYSTGRMSYISSVPKKHAPTMHAGTHTHVVEKNKVVYKQTGCLESALCFIMCGNSLSDCDTASSAAYLRECVMAALIRDLFNSDDHMESGSTCMMPEEF